MAFSIERFVEDCRAVRARPDWAQAVAELLREAIAQPAAIDALIAQRGSSARKGFDVWLQSDDLTIYQVEGRPGLLSPPHDHAGVAVVGVYRGREGYQNYREADGRITPADRVSVSAPDVSVLPADLIHALDNRDSEGSGSIHIYGNVHFDMADRRLWDPETLDEAPYSTSQQFKWTKGAVAPAAKPAAA
jgi:predicted metal-dependent enzyme (double-stranded beta helix superfamily)